MSEETLKLKEKMANKLAKRGAIKKGMEVGEYRYKAPKAHLGSYEERKEYYGKHTGHYVKNEFEKGKKTYK